MKKVFLTAMMLSVVLLSSCGQYGSLYLPDTKKTARVVKKTTEATVENPASTESIVESDSPP